VLTISLFGAIFGLPSCSPQFRRQSLPGVCGPVVRTAGGSTS